MADENKPQLPIGGAPVPVDRGPTLIALVNATAVLAALGTLAYTRLVYKRPLITEDAERVRLKSNRASPRPDRVSALIPFDPVTINIEAQPSHPLPDDGTSQQIQGKLHYCTVAFSLEIADSERKSQVEAIRPLLIDKLLTILGHKKFTDLVTVQGRYVLRGQIMDSANQLVLARSHEDGAGDSKDALISQVYFTQFIVQ